MMFRGDNKGESSLVVVALVGVDADAARVEAQLPVAAGAPSFVFLDDVLGRFQCVPLVEDMVAFSAGYLLRQVDSPDIRGEPK